MKVLVCRHGVESRGDWEEPLRTRIEALAERMKPLISGSCKVISGPGWDHSKTAEMLAHALGGNAEVVEGRGGPTDYHNDNGGPSRMIEYMEKMSREIGTLVVVTSEPAMKSLPSWFNHIYRVPIRGQVGWNHLSAMILDSENGVYPL